MSSIRHFKQHICDIFHFSRQCNGTVPQLVNQPANYKYYINYASNQDIIKVINGVGTLRKKSANEPVRFGLFDAVAVDLFAVVTEDSLPAFFGLD